MSMKTVVPPDFAPVLSAGKHRSPKSGGCFMEFASWLAGEKWSDHPKCTHASLAALARMVNDCTSDEHRSALSTHIPRVIGVNGDDPRISLLVAVNAAAHALPIASEERQRALAVGLLSCERMLADHDPIPAFDSTGVIARALASAPMAAAWARAFVAENRMVSGRRADARITDSIIRISVLAIAQACVSDNDRRMRVLLGEVIDNVRALLGLSDDRVGVSSAVEHGTARARALEFEEPVVARRGDHTIP